MKRIAVVTSSPPLTDGGHMVIARALTHALREAGHKADIVVTPSNRFGRQAAAYMATWLTDVGMSDHGPVDQIISLRYPSYAVRHPRHVCWLNHTMREYYDLWDSFSAGLSPQGRVKERVRRAMMHAADRYLLTRNVDRLFVQSETIRQRLAMWPELRATVLYPPAPHGPYRCERYGDFIFMVSRLTPLKRADLFVKALATPAGSGIRAVIAGDGEERGRLQALVDEYGLGDRVQLVGAVDQAQLLQYLAHCRAVCFPPLQEDYGFVTIEAFSAAKAVVTCRDSGGPAELVRDGVEGIVCDPSAESLAAALKRVIDDGKLAEKMGQAAAARARTINWPDTVAALTSI